MGSYVVQCIRDMGGLLHHSRQPQWWRWWCILEHKWRCWRGGHRAAHLRYRWPLTPQPAAWWRWCGILEHKWRCWRWGHRAVHSRHGWPLCHSRQPDGAGVECRSMGGDAGGGVIVQCAREWRIEMQMAPLNPYTTAAQSRS